MNNREQQNAEIAYIRTKLESAGTTMMMLPPTGTKPRGYTSGWPEIVRDFADLIGAPKENSAVQPRATMRQMNELAEVEEWIVALSNYCKRHRIPWVAKATGLACLRWPLSERPVFRYAKLAKKFDVSSQTIRRWYDQGIEIIASEIDAQFENGGGCVDFNNVVHIPPQKND